MAFYGLSGSEWWGPPTRSESSQHGPSRDRRVAKRKGKMESQAEKIEELEQEVASLKAERQEATEEAQKAMDKMAAEHAAKLGKMEVEHAAKLENMAVEHAAKLDKMAVEHAAELDKANLNYQHNITLDQNKRTQMILDCMRLQESRLRSDFKKATDEAR